MSVQQKCTFCNIIVQNANIIQQTRDVFVISDIKPVSKHHYLVIPKDHILNCKGLRKDDIGLLKEMINEANDVLLKNGADLSDSKLCFHWPPFNTISHLHLHAISPASEMTLMGRIFFKTNSWWCVTPEYMLDRLNE